jgi:phenylpyruvate tautomerase PptA (4-oxalocrotonate tautomerase family)
MPMIDITLRKGSLDDATTSRLADDLLSTLLRWEGAPDNEHSRSLAWAFVNAIDDVRVASSPSGKPHFRIAVTTPQGALDDARRAGLVAEVTELVLRAAGEPNTPENAFRVWVQLHEIDEGSWGAAGTIWRFADIIHFVSGQ